MRLLQRPHQSVPTAPAQQHHTDSEQRIGNSPVDVLGHHAELGHATDARDQVERQEDDVDEGQFFSSVLTLLMMVSWASIRPETTSL